MSLRTRLVLLDLDNTIYDWVAFFVPSLTAMVAELCDALSYLEPSDVLSDLQQVYAKHDSVEYAFAVQALPAVHALPLEDRQNLVARCRRAFRAAREEYLSTYPGVEETLRELASADIKVVAATNAPMYQAVRRLEQLGIARWFDGVAARRSFVVPEDPSVPPSVARNRDKPLRVVRQSWHVAPTDLKPSERMYRGVIEATHTEPAQTLAVGDNRPKDVAPALRIGARGAWARYGADVDKDLWQVLLQVTPWSPSAVQEHQEQASVAQTAVLDSFPDLLKLV